ncbi:hypothetical protein [Scytonema sp. PCC 10023]|uniref:hypothetical protein n=1 Tax=Scytonema sp. PCC 10023 TaxID=1680591 RepID=UPI0039C6D465
MDKSFEEYEQFIEEYNKFLQHYAHSSQLITVMKTSQQQNPQVSLLYEEAVQAHIDATNAYIKTLAMYKELLQKWLLLAQYCYKGR